MSKANFSQEFRKLNNFTEEEIVIAFQRIAANQRKCDKSALHYKCGMITPNVSPFPNELRSYYHAKFLKLLNTQTIYKLVQSKYTESQLLEELLKFAF
jgi:hypothetical protein